MAVAADEFYTLAVQYRYNEPDNGLCVVQPEV